MKTKLFVLCMTIIGVLSCKGNSEEPTSKGEPSSQPGWVAVVNPQFPSSMTITCLPPLGEVVSASDELAVFWGDTCRAVAKQQSGIFYMGISGPENNVAMEIRYYSATYKTIRRQQCTYSPDAQWGSTDNPYRLNFDANTGGPQRIVLKGSFPDNSSTAPVRKVNIGAEDPAGWEGWFWLYWRANDEVRLQNYANNKYVNLQICGGVDTHFGDFEGWWEIQQDENCMVTYPTSTYFQSGDVYYAIPSTQTYVPNNIENDLIPMYGVVQREPYYDFFHFDMHPVVAVLCLPLTSSTGKVVKNITVTVPEKAEEDPNPQIYLSGSNFKTAGVETHPVVSGGTSCSLTLDCGTGVTLSSTATRFLFVVPAITMKEGTTYQITFTDDTFVTKTSKSDLLIGQEKFVELPTVEL